MKQVDAPSSTYLYSSVDGVAKTINSRFKENSSRGYKTTLLGSFKLVRQMPTYSAIGDYPLLAECVKFFISHQIPFIKDEIYRCLKRFEDFNWRQLNFNRELIDSLIKLKAVERVGISELQAI